MTAPPRDFSGVTEVASVRATREQLSMIGSRYREAARRAAGKRVLEVACGPGRGLGYLARHAASVVGGDVTFDLVRQARRHYGPGARVLQLDAQALPFADASFDLVVLFEALYYLPDADRFVAECHRVLAPGGTLLISSVNCEWDGSSPSPMSTRYFAASELRALLERHAFAPEILAGFAVPADGRGGGLVSRMRAIAVALGLMPRTLAGREKLKRLFYGRLTPLGPEIDEHAALDEPVRIPATGRVPDYKILYAVGARQAAPPRG